MIPLDFQAVRDSTNSHFSTILEKLDNLCVPDNTERVKIVLYIDEAQELNVPFGLGDNLKDRTRLDTLLSVLDMFRKQPLFSLLISTQKLLRVPVRAESVEAE